MKTEREPTAPFFCASKANGDRVFHLIQNIVRLKPQPKAHINAIPWSVSDYFN